ncbi:hypothetical protein L211DRAFT_849465 [Terfezia boudieri ATCC MYA-4762]|uniref:SAM domain-containing protein n=1 Tax=Terfezia boudieri ATCC MYA-4762 TaxID=1051890 RepID=A0A3N4LRI4_9PEZI|nr:hypothetical protein L211DRAFT_849465 [Terfezia boudieri ATCC MYA-4762]
MATAESGNSLTIPASLPVDIKDWAENHVATFLTENKERYQFTEADINILKNERVGAVALLSLEADGLRGCGIPMGPTLGILKLVHELKVSKSHDYNTKVAGYPQGLAYKPPKDLLATSGAQWDYQVEAVKEVLRPALTEHYRNYKAQRIDKKTMPLYMFLAGAGTGKSRNANEFRHTVYKILEETNPVHAELADRLRRAWVFHVSFENGTTITPQERKSPTHAVAARMMLQLLPSCESLESIHAGDRSQSLYPASVLDLVCKYYHQSLADSTVILVIDGIHNLIDPQTGDYVYLEEALTRLGDLTHRGFILVCCTSTLSIPVKQLVRRSNRERIYLPVPSLLSPTLNGEALSRHLQGRPALLQAENDCGGHGRALEIFYDQVLNYPAENISYLMSMVEGKLKSQYESAFPSTLPKVEIVKAVLGNKLLYSNSTIPGTTLLVDELCSTGLIRFIPSNEPNHMIGSGYLELPYIWLWLWCKKDLLFQKLQLDDYAFHEQDPTVPTAFGWSNLENFRINFRQLKSMMYTDGEIIQIGEIHRGARMGEAKHIMFKNHHLNCVQLTNQTNTRTTNENGKVWEVHAKWAGQSEGQIDLRKCNHIARNAPSAPYGDAVMCLDTTTGPVMNEVYQWKHTSQVGLKLSRKQLLKEITKAIGTDPRDIFIVSTPNHSCSDIVDLPDNIIIIDKDSWVSYHGPFSGRAYRFAVSGNSEG